MWINGNVAIQMGVFTDKINILRVKPYKIPEVDWIILSTEFLTYIYHQNI